MNSIRKLLETLRERNDGDDFGGLLRQVVSPPEPLRSIATLDPNKRHGPSPMLRERFKYAGAWENASAGGRWLSLSDMESLLETKRVRKQIGLRMKHWPASSIAGQPPGRLSLYGIDKEDGNETYLLWGRKPEPQIVAFYGWDEKVFQNLGAYLKFLTAE